MSFHTRLPADAHSQVLSAGCGCFELVKASPSWICIRHVAEGHDYTFFFNPAHTALASVSVKPSLTGRYGPEYYEEAAWRCADRAARNMQLIFGPQSRAA